MTLSGVAIHWLRTLRVPRVGRCAIVRLLWRPSLAGVVRRSARGNDTLRVHDWNRAFEQALDLDE